jgi:hypothetical protein
MSIHVDKAEALVDAIGFVNQFYKPDSLAYTLRSPLLLRSFSRNGKHIINEEGLRQFDSMLAGIHASYFDVACKLNGRSNSGIQKTDLLINLLKVYGINQEKDQTQVVSFLRKALSNPSITLQTPLNYFAEVQ